MVGVCRKIEFLFHDERITNDTKKSAILLSSMRPATFHLMCSLVLPNALDTSSCDNLATKVRNYKELKPSIIVRHFQLSMRNQKPRKSLPEYVGVLCKALSKVERN